MTHSIITLFFATLSMANLCGVSDSSQLMDEQSRHEFFAYMLIIYVVALLGIFVLGLSDRTKETLLLSHTAHLVSVLFLLIAVFVIFS